jgi:hypothetical protein
LFDVLLQPAKATSSGELLTLSRYSKARSSRVRLRRTRHVLPLLLPPPLA